MHLVLSSPLSGTRQECVPQGQPPHRTLVFFPLIRCIVEVLPCNFPRRTCTGVNKGTLRAPENDATSAGRAPPHGRPPPREAPVHRGTSRRKPGGSSTASLLGSAAPARGYIRALHANQEADALPLGRLSRKRIGCFPPSPQPGHAAWIPV